MTKNRTAIFPKLKAFTYQNQMILIFIGLALSIFRGLESRWEIQQGDAAGFVDAMTDQSKTGDINFTYGFSLDALRKLFGLNPSELTSDNFQFSRADKPFIHWHPYLFGYFVRLFPDLFEVQVLPLLFLASSYSLGLILILREIQLSKISLPKKIAIIILFLASPILIGAINGQPYFDKMFFGPCIAILFLLLRNKENKRYRVQKIVILLVLSFTLSERISLMAALMVFAVLILFWREVGLKYREALIIVGTCLVGIFWYLLWSKVISWNPDMQNTSFQYFLPNFRDLFFGFRKANFIIFSLNVLPLLILTLLKFRYSIIALCVVTPNLIVNIGGAELAGYSTHYHSVYLPILMCLGTLAIIDENEKAITRMKQSVLMSLSIALTISGAINTARINTNLDLKGALQIQIQEAADAFGVIPDSKMAQRNAMKSELEELFAIFRENADQTISAPESFMPALTSMGFGSVNYFPIGVGSDDLLVVPFADDMFTNIEVSIYGLVPIESRDRWSEVILGELNQSYKILLKRSGFYGNIVLFEKISPN